MMWLAIIAGFVVGGALSESIAGAFLGALLGLALYQGRQQRNAQDALRQRVEALEATTRLQHNQLEVLRQRMRSGASPLTTEVAPGDVAAEAAEPSDPTAQTIAPAPAEPAPPRSVAEAIAAPVARVEGTESVTARPPQGAGEHLSQHAVPTTTQQQRSTDDTPTEPGPVERIFNAGRDWLLGGNTVLRIGAALLFLGLAFLLRYATENIETPLWLRYAGVSASALTLLALGGWLRARRAAYALVLQGTGLAILYLTIFAAMRLHALLEPGIAFALLVSVTAASVWLAVRQNALGLAMAAALGGFAAPLLASSDSGNVVALFSYLLVLDAGLAAVALYKAWRPLNLIGFAGTFGIAGLWVAHAWDPAHYASVQPFIAAFILLYVLIGLLFARRRLLDAASVPEGRDALLAWSRRHGDYVDATTMFGPPLIGFGLQYAITAHFEQGVALSALVFGCGYLLLARGLAVRGGQRVQLLTEVCLALGVIFVTLAVPLALQAQWTSAVWAIEGAGIFWIATRQRRPLARGFALLLQAGAALFYLTGLRPGEATLLDGAPLGALMLGVAFLFSLAVLLRGPDFSRTADGNPDPHGATEDVEHPACWLALAGLGSLYLLPPLLFASYGTALGWAVAGLATLWAGIRLGAPLFAGCGLVIQSLAGFALLSLAQPASNGLATWSPVGSGTLPLLDVAFWAPLSLALSALAGAWLLQHEHRLRTAGPFGPPQCAARGHAARFENVLLWWGAAWWTLVLCAEITRFVPPALEPGALLLAAAGSALTFGLLARRLHWHALAQRATLALPAAAIVLLLALGALFPPRYQPASLLAWLGWMALFAAHLGLLLRLGPLLTPTTMRWVHPAGVWLLLALASLELQHALVGWAGYTETWRWFGLALPSVLWLLFVARTAHTQRLPWPLSASAHAYRVVAAIPPAILLFVGFWLVNARASGRADPLPYVPLLNPLELMLLLSLVAIALWLPLLGHARAWPSARLARLRATALGVSLFALITATVFRGGHHFAGIAFELPALLASMQVQAALSLIWTSVAFALMGLGHRLGRRQPWLAGAALIAVVVIKLFVVELRDHGGLERIVSFIGVGALLLVVGYFTPLPPREHPGERDGERIDDGGDGHDEGQG